MSKYLVYVDKRFLMGKKREKNERENGKKKRKWKKEYYIK